MNLFFEVPVEARPKDFVPGYQPPATKGQFPPPAAGQANGKEASTATVEVELAEVVLGGLVRVTVTGRDGGERVEACFNATTGKILKRLGNDRGALLFAQVIAQLKEVEVVKRKLAVKALGDAGDTKALPALQDIVQHDPNADVRESAQSVIAQLRP